MVTSSIKSGEIRFGECNKQLLEEVIFYGISLGADFVELFIENSDNSSVLAEEDFITSVSPSFGKGAGIRIFKDKRDGFVSTNDLSKHGLMRSISQAIEMLDISEKTNNSIFNGLSKGIFEIHFPKKFTVILKIISLLPYRLFFQLTAKLTGRSK